MDETTLKGLTFDESDMKILGRFNFVNYPNKACVYVEITNKKNGNKIRAVLHESKMYKLYKFGVTDKQWQVYYKQCESLDANPE